MKNRDSLEVYIGGKHVGTLANSGKLVAFEYSDEWIREGYSISPLSLPLEKQVFIPKGYEPFGGVFGVFADSLPDGWGRLLLDRVLSSRGIRPYEVNTLTRLAIVGSTGMGALEYVPNEEFDAGLSNLSLDEVAEECRKVFDNADSEHLDELYRLGGSSGGARPKILYKLDDEDWIVKFPSHIDPKNIGEEEYDYSSCARKCGVEMSETRLLSSNTCSGYFATKRFDRDGGKIHMISASALLETSHRLPNLDYNILMQLTMKLTQSYDQLEKLYRLMCFNVFAHNRDDHSRNFSYIYDINDGSWKLSPAYDLTYSNSLGGEHATTIDGNGVNPGLEDLLAVADKAKLDAAWSRQVALEIRDIVNAELGGYLEKRR